MTRPAPTVLYITGMMRSGSTLVGNILNEVDEVVHVGELHFLWKNLTLASGSNSTCGCGDALVSCDFWRPILAERLDMGAAHEVVAGQRRLTRVRHTVERVFDPGGPGRSEPVVRERLAAYRAVAASAGAKIVVDSSKVPVETLILAATREVDLRILHVVRSVQDTVQSYRSAKSYIRPLSAPTALGYWMSFNVSAEIAAARAQVPYLRMRYEDLVADPRSAVGAILAFAGSENDPPISAEGVAELGVNHTVTGNPDRFQRGRVTVAARARKGSYGERVRGIAVAAVAAPLVLRYGYRPHVDSIR